MTKYALQLTELQPHASADKRRDTICLMHSQNLQLLFVDSFGKSLRQETWVVDWLVGWLINWLVEWLLDRSIG